MPDTSHHYLCPRSTVVEQWQSDRVWIEVVDFDGVMHTYHLRAEGNRLVLSHSTEPVDGGQEP